MCVCVSCWMMSLLIPSGNGQGEVKVPGQHINSGSWLPSGVLVDVLHEIKHNRWQYNIWVEIQVCTCTGSLCLHMYESEMFVQVNTNMSKQCVFLYWWSLTISSRSLEPRVLKTSSSISCSDPTSAAAQQCSLEPTFDMSAIDDQNTWIPWKMSSQLALLHNHLDEMIHTWMSMQCGCAPGWLTRQSTQWGWMTANVVECFHSLDELWSKIDVVGGWNSLCRISYIGYTVWDRLFPESGKTS